MNDSEQLNQYEETLNGVLRTFLLARGEIDHTAINMEDMEDKWEEIAQSYLPDGVVEFKEHPIASLGWMMFIGMAVLQYWDVDYNFFEAHDDFFPILRDARGYDCMDEYICEEVLGLDAAAADALSTLVGDTTEMAYRMLMRESFEPGTASAFYGYVRTLHQLYIAGYTVQLKRTGYSWQKL